MKRLLTFLLLSASLAGCLSDEVEDAPVSDPIPAIPELTTETTLLGWVASNTGNAEWMFSADSLPILEASPWSWQPLSIDRSQGPELLWGEVDFPMDAFGWNLEHPQTEAASETSESTRSMAYHGGHSCEVGSSTDMDLSPSDAYTLAMTQPGWPMEKTDVQIAYLADLYLHGDGCPSPEALGFEGVETNVYLVSSTAGDEQVHVLVDASSGSILSVQEGTFELAFPLLAGMETQTFIPPAGDFVIEGVDARHTVTKEFSIEEPFELLVVEGFLLSGPEVYDDPEWVLTTPQGQDVALTGDSVRMVLDEPAEGTWTISMHVANVPSPNSAYTFDITALVR